MMLWVTLSILAAIAWAFANIIDKNVLHTQKPLTIILFANFISIIAAVIVYFFLGFSKLSALNIIIGLLVGLFYILGIYFYCLAVQGGEVSRVIPLFNMIPLFIMLLAAIFLGEILTPLNYIGSLILISGAILISANKKTKLNIDKIFWLVVLGSLAFAINAVLQKYLLNFADFWTVFSYERIGAFFALLPLLLIYYSDFKKFIKGTRKPIVLVSLSEVFNLIGLLLTTIAFSIGLVSLVKTLSSIQDLFVLFFVIMITTFWPKVLKEKIDKSTIILKVIAIILIGVGVFLIT